MTTELRQVHATKLEIRGFYGSTHQTFVPETLVKFLTAYFNESPACWKPHTSVYIGVLDVSRISTPIWLSFINSLKDRKNRIQRFEVSHMHMGKRGLSCQFWDCTFATGNSGLVDIYRVGLLPHAIEDYRESSSDHRLSIPPEAVENLVETIKHRPSYAPSLRLHLSANGVNARDVVIRIIEVGFAAQKLISKETSLSVS
jgi:hypothetical protein